MSTRDATVIFALIRLGGAAVTACAVAAAALWMWRLPSPVAALVAIAAAGSWTCWLERQMA